MKKSITVLKVLTNLVLFEMNHRKKELIGNSRAGARVGEFSFHYCYVFFCGLLSLLVLYSTP